MQRPSRIDPSFALTPRAGVVPARRGRARVRGLTLVELMITVAIAAILLAVGVPALQQFILTNRLATTANDLVAAISLARSEALRLGGAAPAASVCAASGGADWSAGWSVVKGACGGTALRSGALDDASLTLRSTVASIGFDAQGRKTTAGTTALVLCAGATPSTGGASTSRAVLVAASGRIRVADTAGNGNPLDDAGSEISSCTPP